LALASFTVSPGESFYWTEHQPAGISSTYAEICVGQRRFWAVIPAEEPLANVVTGFALDHQDDYTATVRGLVRSHDSYGHDVEEWPFVIEPGGVWFEV
jgi:hypothetical protein